MKEYLLIDGYNVIHTWDVLKEEMNEISLESARDKLLEIVANYQGYRNIKTTVVFDAHYVKNSMETHMSYCGVEVVYTKEFESADGYIERTIAKMDKDDIIRVVTADFLEQLQILGYGAVRVTIHEFIEELIKVSNKMKQDAVLRQSSGRNRLETLIDENTRMILEEWRRAGTKGKR